MRRIAAAAAVFILILGLVRISPHAAEDGAPTVKNPGTWGVVLNAKETGIMAIHRDGRIYIEAKKILEAFGWVVFWNQGASQIAANSRNGDLFVHTIESAQSAVNGNSAVYQTPSIQIDGTAYLPLPMLEPLLRVGNIIEDNQRRTMYMYKTFETTEKNKQANRILQAVNLDNYNPLMFLEYLRYQADNPSLSVDKAILYVNIGVHIPPYSDIKPVENPHDVFAIVDKNHKFSDDFAPELTWIDGYRWAKDAGDAWVRMMNAARADGVTLALNNTYRSIADQRANYNRKIGSGRSVDNVDRFNARPGHSEHHTGYAADMAGLGSFVGTRAHSWLVKNGHQYGFIISFQAGKEFINHYSPEGWHIRWFPVIDAKIMYDENLTIQEYDNLYLNPRKHGFSVDKSIAQAIAETDYAVKWDFSATPADQAVLVNNEPVILGSYNIGGNNYFKLRDLAFALSGTDKQFDVSWDSASNTIVLVSGQPYTAIGGEMSESGDGIKSPKAVASRIILDGEEIALIAYFINGSNYFKLRDIRDALGFEVNWDAENNTIAIGAMAGYSAD